jgi:hypothetical protein
MKKLITNSVIITMALGIFGVNAGELTGVGVDLNSAYVFRGATVNDELNLNPYLDADIGGGLSVGVWANVNTDASNTDEVDLSASYALPAGLSLGYTEYVYPNQANDADDGAAESDRELSLSMAVPGGLPLDPAIAVFLGVDGALDGDLYVELTGGHSLALSDSMAIDIGATLGYVADTDGGETGLSHLTLSAGTGFDTGLGAIDVGVSYVVETDDSVLAVDEDLFVTIGLAL